MSKLKILSLFSGLGGMDHGVLGGFDFLGKRYQRLPAEIVLAVDADKKACEIYKANAGPIRCGDIREVAEWPEADLIIGGPPCQPFSRGGKGQGAGDERNLIDHFQHTVTTVRPAGFLMENVPGLLHGKHVPYWQEVVEAFEEAGYRVQWRVLDALDFGVPQKRKRLFVQGWLESGSEKFVWPKPDRTATPVTLREAIADLEEGGHRLPIRRLKQGQRRYPTFNNGARRLEADQPVGTITAQDTGCQKVYHPWFDRPLSPRELLRCMGFPDSFVLEKPSFALGNAVCPIVAHGVMQSMISGFE